MDIIGYQIRPTKHFVLTWMRKWSYDVDSLKEAIVSAQHVEKVGKFKYEIYVSAKGKSR